MVWYLPINKLQVNCLGGPFTVQDINYAWWNDVDGKIQTFWSGSDATVHTCQCGIEDNCVRPDLECNCDANVAVPLSDNGIILLKFFEIWKHLKSLSDAVQEILRSKMFYR
jgi:hypothetical protein